MGQTVEQVAAKLGITRTSWIVDEVPDVYRAFEVVSGIYRPEEPYDWTSPETQSESSVRRYGVGAGIPIKHEADVGSAISIVPDREHAFKGSLRIRGGGDATYLPNERACALYGIDRDEWSRGINLLDLSFLPDLQQRLYDADNPAVPEVPAPAPQPAAPPPTPRSTVQEAVDHARHTLIAHGFQERGGGDIARALRGLLATLGV